jgi:Gluconate 2-dehydrogenase subunit 3
MDITRRNALKIIGATPVAAGIGGLAPASAAPGRGAAGAPQSPAGASYQPTFFDAHEWATVGLLVDIVIPKDERSGSASDAGAPQFIDFMMMDRPEYQVPMRGGLRWLDGECNRRFDKVFTECTDDERRQVLDDIAYPARVSPELSQGAAFFSRFRDLTATGFWTSKMGIEDLQYIGNRPLAEWTGCPDECLTHLGVKA